MGNRAHPKAMRLGIVKDWESDWFSDSNAYAENVLHDYEIRRYIKTELARAGVALVEIIRKSEVIDVKVYVARPGIVFGRNGIDVKLLNEELALKIGKKLTINVIEQKNVDANARLLAEWVATQLENRVAFRRAMKMCMQKALKAGVKGIRVKSSGRLGGVEIARNEGYDEGKVPLQTLRADIDYAFAEALTTYGKIGVKVWVYNGDILPVGKKKTK
jgi:small subunit ribosomal protein S3